MLDQVQIDWRTERFVWKKKVHHSQHLTPGAKCLACFLCDQYARKHDGACWPSNKTLAQALAVDVRTIQRHVLSLKQQGWITTMKTLGRRRVILLRYPHAGEHDSKDDTTNLKKVTAKSFEHDRNVAPYKNLENNQEKSGQTGSPTKCIFVSDNEVEVIQRWRNWIEAYIDFKCSEVLELLRSRNGYHLPERYPKEGPEHIARYNAFFEQAIRKAS
ncbi:Helix-turn-helix domain-containing protein [Poseidonocella pacifica]|uniref:Helix-turn-helix domain-containing protein n=1 Tax=Poseidonocella pacifica TaxID=871651 RepID=A0A1I0YHM9_9RHOB|nr:helix-turn-helix domain-containing protein [Poseidonocella pacifica]SFB12834.1 Helix-turn-helix domain-containing protein [Poseidonocella pacifica]